MANRRATFTQSALTKVLKAHRDANVPQPKMIIEADKITIIPVGSTDGLGEPNPWDAR